MIPSVSPVRAAVVCLVCAMWVLGHPSSAAGEPKIKSVGSEHNARSPIGTNLNGLSDWSLEWTFVDHFKESRDWISSAKDVWDDGRPIDLDENGWVKSLRPGQVARTLMFWSDGERHIPAGRYTVLFEGEGRFTTFPHRFVELEPGKYTLWVDPSRGGIALTIEATDPDNYIRNIRVFGPEQDCAASSGATEFCAPPDTPASSRFNPLFLDSIKSFRALRFMNWMHTNNSKTVTFDQRPKLSDARYTPKGPPLEVMVELANLVKADPWFTLSHLADDDFIEKFATYVRDHLDPDRLVYVEYSNEVWNTIFPQTHYASEQGQKLGLSQEWFEGALRYYSRRSVEIFRIWERVFGGTSRLVRVMGAQVANPWVSETVLAFEDAHRFTDALAIAPYFGGYAGAPEEAPRYETMSVEDFLADLRTRGMAEVKDMLERQKAVADRFDVEMIAYEGGQHMVGVGPEVDNERLNALFLDVNRHPAMKDLYLTYLDLWRESGGALFMHFLSTSANSKWGYWGAREYLTQPLSQAPKADALQTYIHTYPTD